MNSRRRVNSTVMLLLLSKICKPKVAMNYKAICCVSVLWACLVSTAQAQELTSPRFEDYPVSERFRGTPAPVNLRSARGASMFRTKLREGAQKGPNFAGHYTVITWGCGSDCRSVAIFDARTGRVYFAPFTVSIPADADYRLNSRLLIANPPERTGWYENGGQMRDVYKPSWWVWRNGHLTEILPKKVRSRVRRGVSR